VRKKNLFRFGVGGGGGVVKKGDREIKGLIKVKGYKKGGFR